MERNKGIELLPYNYGVGYPFYLQGKLAVEHPVEYTVVNRGVSGNRISDLYARLKSDCWNLCPDVDMVITGEICEWAWGEYARDADSLGITKSLIVTGHIGSERAAMARLVNELVRYFPSVKYYECGEVYTYTDDTTA